MSHFLFILCFVFLGMDVILRLAFPVNSLLHAPVFYLALFYGGCVDTVIGNRIDWQSSQLASQLGQDAHRHLDMLVSF